MNEHATMVAEATARLFTAHCTTAVHAGAENAEWQQGLWDRCEEAGLTAPHDAGGLDIAAVIVRTAARHAAPIPLTETILARNMLSAAGIDAPAAGPLTIAPVRADALPTLTRQASGWVLSGSLERVPWGRSAGAAILARDHAATRTILLERLDPVKLDRNYAREPRDRIVWNATPVADAAVGTGWSAEKLLLMGALFRAIAMTGAMEQILNLTLRYAQDRVQFGRPIGRFQAVQQQIAVLASHVAASSAAVQGAIATQAEFEIAAAKLRVGEAAGVVAEIAHQVHGAMGFTHEHALHRFTRRLWSWRDEFGAEADWAISIGWMVCGLGGGEQLWPFLTDQSMRGQNV